MYDSEEATKGVMEEYYRNKKSQIIVMILTIKLSHYD